MDTKRADIDYSKSSFDSYEVNPYELVIAISKTARGINRKAQKYMSPDIDIRPVNIALKKLENNETKFTYKNEEEETASSEEISTAKDDTETKPDKK